jgi:hypothetical protein
LLSNLGV